MIFVWTIVDIGKAERRDGSAFFIFHIWESFPLRYNKIG